MAVKHSLCTTAESIAAEQTRTRLIGGVWRRLIEHVSSRKRANLRQYRSDSMRQAKIRRYCKLGEVEFHSMAEVIACGCDAAEYEQYWPVVAEPAPTQWRPGSLEKMAILSARLHAGEEMHHDDDFAARDDGDTPT